jgi:hypothetical protein
MSGSSHLVLHVRDVFEKHSYYVKAVVPRARRRNLTLYEVYPMKTIIQMSEAEEAKALPLLLRHSPATVLPNRIYVVSEEAAKKLHEAGVQFTELSRESNMPSLEGVGSGERI